MEEWKDIDGFVGEYQVSDLGNVRSLDFERPDYLWGGIIKVLGRVLKPCQRAQGYLYVILCRRGIRKQIAIHRLVALAFIPNPENKPQVNHINGIKWDNRKINLEWSTESENEKHAYRTGLKSPCAGNSKINLAIAQDIRAESLQGTGTKDLSIKYNLSKSQISAILRNEKWTE